MSEVPFLSLKPSGDRTRGPVLAFPLAAGVAAALWLALGVEASVAFPPWVYHLLKLVVLCVTGAIFAVGWQTWGISRNRRSLILGGGFLAVAACQSAALLSIQGVPDFITQNSLPKVRGFELLSHGITALTLMVVAMVPAHAAVCGERDCRWLLPGVLMALAVSALVAREWFLAPSPETAALVSSPGAGIAILIILGLVALRLLIVGSVDGVLDTGLLVAALLALGLSELIALSPIPPSAGAALATHGLEVMAYLFLFRALFVETVVTPHREIRHSREYLECVFAAIPDHIFELDEDGRFTFAHVSSRTVFDHRIHGLVGYRVEELFPGMAAAVRDAMAEACRRGFSYGKQFRYDTEDGPHWFEFSVSHRRDPVSGQSRYVVVPRDITARVADQQTLRTLRMAVEQSPSHVVITDLEGRIEFVNLAFYEATGYREDEIIGHNPSLMQSGKTPRSTYESLWKSLRAGKPWRGEFINRRKDGSEYTESAWIFPVHDENGIPSRYMGIKEDVTERKRDRERIEYLANFDALTGLPNRVYFASRFEQALGISARRNEPLALMFLDLDQFKDINDTLGHHVGDALLIEIADRLKRVLRPEDTVSRLGGDEFIFVLPLAGEELAAHVAEQLLKEVSRLCVVAGQELVVTASIGIALYPDDGADFDILGQRADAAMYRAKHAGRNSFLFFSPDMQAHASRQLRLENALHFALAEDQLDIHYQPQYELSGGRLVGMEALLRWHHPEYGTVDPAEFIGIAESTGQILELGRWVMHTAIRRAAAWHTAGYRELVVAVNLSPVQFRQLDLTDMIGDCLAEAGLPPASLELELTESTALMETEHVTSVLSELRELGVRLAIDDFGAGYFSFNQLRELRGNKLKLDSSFVQRLGEEGCDRSIVSAVINMSASLGMTVLAEGVESAAQLRTLRELGCDQVQGFYCSRPLDTEAVEQLLAEGATEASG